MVFTSSAGASPWAAAGIKLSDSPAGGAVVAFSVLIINDFVTLSIACCFTVMIVYLAAILLIYLLFFSFIYWKNYCKEKWQRKNRTNMSNQLLVSCVFLFLYGMRYVCWIVYVCGTGVRLRVYCEMRRESARENVMKVWLNCHSSGKKRWQHWIFSCWAAFNCKFIYF